MLVASCPHLEAWWAGGSEGNGFESQEVAWEFQGNGGVGLALGPGRGSLPRPCRRPLGCQCCLAQVWGAPGPLLFSSLGLHHTCALFPSTGSMRGTSATLCAPGCPCLWHCPRGGAREGEGDMDSAPAPGSAGELVLSRWVLLAPPPLWTSLARLGQGRGALWAHSDLASRSRWAQCPPEVRWVGARGSSDSAHTTPPPPRLCGPLRLSVYLCETGMQRQAGHLPCRLGLRWARVSFYVCLAHQDSVSPNVKTTQMEKRPFPALLGGRSTLPPAHCSSPLSPPSSLFATLPTHPSTHPPTSPST